MQSYLISLVRRQDRRSLALAEFAKVKITPQVWYGVDGKFAQPPNGWQFGSGCYGCYASHLSVIADAVKNNYDQFAVFEDDVVFAEDFTEGFKTLLSQVPADWDAVFLGGEHIVQPRAVKPGVVKCLGTIRRHAYVLRRRYAGELQLYMRKYHGHGDYIWSTFQAEFNVYAPEKWLCGQREGTSDIDGNTHPERFFNDTTGGTNH